MNNRIFAVLLICLAAPATAETIAIIGTGDVARALGPEFAAQGHTIVYGSRSPGRSEVQDLVSKTGEDASVVSPQVAVLDADIVVLAVPGMLVEEITLGLGDLAGKIIIDPTNPLVDTETGLGHGVDTSNAEIIQSAAPKAHVVKAFNTLSWRTMIDPESSGGPVSIPLTGNSDAAKATVAELVAGMGLEPVDVGPVQHSRWVEGLLILWINNRFGSDRPNFEIHLRQN